MVLFPDKHSWCEKQEIKQVISFPGCKSIEIDNNVCVGACFSYSIPHTEPSDPGEVIVPYCDSCQPSDTRWHEVTLDCREGHQNDPEQAPKLVKRLQLIRNCSCISCEKSGIGKHQSHTNEDDSPSLFRDVPDLLDSINMMNETERDEVEMKHRESLRSILNNTLMTLVKNMHESNSAKDKAQLKDLLKMIRDQYPEDEVTDESIAEFLDMFQKDQVQLEIPKLKEILFKFELSKHNHAFKPQKSHEDSNPSIETNEIHHYDPHGAKQDSNELLHHLSNKNKHHLHQHNKHHHHLGETIDNDAHLVHGPHGSLVVERKIAMNPHELKPNHAGTMLSYGSLVQSHDETSQEDGE